MTKKIIKTSVITAIILAASFMTVNASNTEGWKQVGSDWQYLINEKPIKNTWLQSDVSGLWYFLDEDGIMATNSFINQDTKEVEEIPSEIGDTYYYVNENGAMVTDWRLIDSDNRVTSPSDELKEDGWFYFDKSGKMMTSSWIQSPYSGIWYAIGEDGEMLTNKIVHNNIKKESGSLYYVNSKGEMITGWYKTKDNDVDFVEDSWIFADTNGKLIQDGWKKINNKWCYFGEATYNEIKKDKTISQVVTGGSTYAIITNALLTVDDETFYLNDDGYVSTGLQNFKDENGTTFYYYFKSNGVMMTSDSDLADNQVNVFKAKEEDDKYFAIDKDNKVLRNGFVYTDIKDSTVFTIVNSQDEIPKNSYYYKLNSSSSLKTKK